MSRNKFILLFAILVIIYLVMPSEGIYGSIKANVVMALPFLMMGVIIYLFTTVIVMKRAWKKLDNYVIDDNVIAFAKIMNISFDVKRMMGVNNLLDLYAKVNFSRHASMKAKELLYQAMRRKRLDVPPPGQGVFDGNVPVKPNRTNAEIKAARIEAAARARKKKNKK